MVTVQHDRNKRKNQPITLIELLLLTAIIAILAGMVLMAVRLVRGQAIQVSYMSNQCNQNRSVVCGFTGRVSVTHRQDTVNPNGIRNPKTSQWERGDT